MFSTSPPSHPLPKTIPRNLELELIDVISGLGITGLLNGEAIGLGSKGSQYVNEVKNEVKKNV